MTDPLGHRNNALEHIEDAAVQQQYLEGLLAADDVPNRHPRIAQCHQTIGQLLKLAHIEATLDVAAAFRDWTEVSHELDDDERRPVTLLHLPAHNEQDDQ